MRLHPGDPRGRPRRALLAALAPAPPQAAPAAPLRAVDAGRHGGPPRGLGPAEGRLGDHRARPQGAVREAAPQVPHAHVVGEPVGKNTAPAVALASWWLRRAGEDARSSCSRRITGSSPPAPFREELDRAARIALERGVIVTLRHSADAPRDRVRLHRGRRPARAGLAVPRGLRLPRETRTWRRPPATSPTVSTSGTRGCSSSRPA